MMKPQITIATTTYNREHLLPRTIESVLSQTFENFEYLIVDNGSTDSTASIIAKYAQLDSRIKPYRYPVNDIGTTRKKAYYELVFHHCEAPLYMSIDDDDYMDCRAVDTLHSLLTDHHADIATVGSQWVYADSRVQNKYVFDDVFVFDRVQAMVELLKREKFNSAMGGKLYRKELLHIEFPQVDCYRDIYGEYRVINQIHRMAVSGAPLYFFYRHGQNLSGLNTKEQITPEKMRQHLTANRIRSQWLTAHMPEIKDFVHYCEASFMISLYTRIYALNVGNCYAIAEKMRESVLDISRQYQIQQFCRQDELQALFEFQVGGTKP